MSSWRCVCTAVNLTATATCELCGTPKGASRQRAKGDEPCREVGCALTVADHIAAFGTLVAGLADPARLGVLSRRKSYLERVGRHEPREGTTDD